LAEAVLSKSSIIHCKRVETLWPKELLLGTKNKLLRLRPCFHSLAVDNSTGMQSLSSSAQGGQQQHVINNDMYSNTASHRRVGSSPIGGRVPDTSRDGRKLFVGGLLNEGKKCDCSDCLKAFLWCYYNTSPLSYYYTLHTCYRSQHSLLSTLQLRNEINSYRSIIP